MDPYAIETHGLRKLFGDKVAVSNLTLSVEAGEVFGFLGPNGAGKTTSVKMLLNLVFPSGGEGRLFGRPLSDPQVRSRVGFLPEHFRFHDWLTGEEFLALHADLYRLPRAEARGRIAELLDLVSLTPHAAKKLREYSKGMLQRIGLAQALLNRPGLVILDEPTSGLDPVGRRMVRDIIRHLRSQGTTVFINSHLLSEVEITCDRVAFIKHGEVIRISSLEALVEGELTVDIRARNLTPETIAGLERWGKNVRQEGVRQDDVRQNGDRQDGDRQDGARQDVARVTLALSGEADLPEINRYLVAHGVDVYELRPQRMSLEDLFIQIVGTDGGL